MATLLDSLIRLSAPIAEAGLTVADEALRGAQSLLGQALGDGESAFDTPPVEGPRNAEEATADFANRLLRGALRTPWRPSAMPDAARQMLEAAAESFPLGEPRRWLDLPFKMPLAVASLATQEALRGLVAAQFTPARQLPEFLSFVVETFTDLHVYFSLQYTDELKHWQERLRRDRRDHRARLELGRTYLKCGLYPEAVAELERLKNKPAWKRRALYESMIARYRAGDAAGAIADGAASLRLDRSRLKTRHWLWLSAQKAGGYPESVAPELRMEARDGYHPTAVRLEDVAAELGLDKTSGGRGSVVADFHGDGRLDVAFAGAHAGCSLYRNLGDGTFQDVSTGSGLDACVYGFGLAAGDYDNDGKTDLYVSSLGFFNGQGRLLRNEGAGDDGQITFRDVTVEAGLETWGPGFTATWVDYDGDGFLDLYLANNLGGFFDRKTPNRLFHNNGDGTFTDVTKAVGLDTPWTSIGAAWGDFSNNGRPDLFVSCLGRAQLYRNNGGGADGMVTFTDVSREAGVDAPANGSVALVCDLDDDGWLDIVQLTYSRPEDAIYTLRHGHGPRHGSPMRVFRNRRDGTFTDIAGKLGITGCWGTMSANAGDFDNDGYQDLFLGNGDPAMDRTEASVLLRGDGRGTFSNVSFTAGLPFTGKGHGVNLADLAGDGRLHLIVASGGLYPGDLSTNAVYRPTALPGNYLNVRLTGTTSNRDAIGARVRLTAGGRHQHRLVSGGSFFGCLPLEQHFGLGDLEKADSLRIRWPSGRRQTVGGLPVNTTIRIVEGRDGWEEVYRRSA